MRKKILVRAPVLTRSGYGEHSRFLIRALRSREDIFDIYIIPVNWGQTGWLLEDSEERAWIDERIRETATYGMQGGKFDISIQVTIPNEWEQLAPVNIGVTAGIESTNISTIWVEKANIMDKVITISEHSKRGFDGAMYHGQNRVTGEPMVLKCEVPVEVVHYPVKEYDELPDLDLDLEYDFNYIINAQAGPRKNIDNTIRWFIEENFDQKVGLVVKTYIKNNSINDRRHSEDLFKKIISEPKYADMKCKVYLLHGDLTDVEMHAVYRHPKIKCLVSLTHGEGFGLPLFEAAYSGLPIIAPGWSGHCDFLYAPNQSSTAKRKKSNKTKKHPHFAEVEYTLGPIPEETVWPGVLERDSMWCYPQEGSYKMRLRQMRKNYSKWEKKAKTLQKWVLKNFDSVQQHEKFITACVGDLQESNGDWFSDIKTIVQEYE